MARKHPNRSAIPSNVARGMVLSKKKAGPMRDRRLRRPKDARRKTDEVPLVDTCPECNGKGEVQLICEVCGVDLTEGNAADGEGYLCVGCEDYEIPFG